MSRIDSHGFVTPSMGLSIVSSRRFPPFWWPGNTKDFSSFAERKSRVIEAIPKAQASPLTPWGVVGGGWVSTPPTPQKKTWESIGSRKKSNKIEMGGSLGLTCVFSRDVLTSWMYVGFLDVCWLLGCVRYSLFKIPLLSKTSPLYPRHQT